MNIPKLRFKDDDGREFSEWEDKTIDAVAEVTTGDKDTQNKIDDGAYPFFVRSQTVERINSYSFDGEAILTSGDGVGVGKNYHYINGKFDFHQRVYCLHSFKEGVNGKFIFHYFSEHFNKRVLQLSAKNSVDSVRRSMVTDMPINIPTYQEQTKIANFLTAIDEKITQLTQKYDLLKQYKKGVMQQIFSQKLRFKDDDGQEFPEWEIATLEDVSIKYYQGINTAADKIEYFDGGVPIIQAKHITGEHLDFSDARGLNETDYQKYKDKYNPKINDLLISNIGTLGKVVLVESNIDFLIAWNIFKVTLNTKNCYPRFIKEFLKKISSDGYFESIKTGNATKFINKSDMLAINIDLPSIAEQTKIANFLTAVDEKINQTQAQLDAVKLYKKGLLQQLFV